MARVRLPAWATNQVLTQFSIILTLQNKLCEIVVPTTRRVDCEPGLVGPFQPYFADDDDNAEDRPGAGADNNNGVLCIYSLSYRRGIVVHLHRYSTDSH